jgi:hypothetical protein
MSEPKTITYDIDDPADARTYVAAFGPRLLGKRATYVETNQRRIEFASMSDADACWVASLLWEMEQKARARQRSRRTPP